MKITYFYRSPSNNVSIERVFNSIISGIKECDRSIDTKNFYAQKYKGLFVSMIRNMINCRKYSKEGINHITGDIHYCSLLMSKDRTILTIHDLVSLHNPTTPMLLKFFVWMFWYYLPLKRLKYITCISKATYDDIIHFFPWAKDKVLVIPNPVDTSFTFNSKNININYPRILHVGTRDNKNLNRVILALSGLSCHLRIIGQLTDEQINLLKISNIDYSNSYNLTDSEIIQEYINSDIISFPSTFEGFGMPIIEGQSIGRPVLTSNLEPMKSVAGDGAIFVNPYDIEDIKNGFNKIVNGQINIDQLISLGVMNAEKYNLKTISRQYLSLYNSIK